MAQNMHTAGRTALNKAVRDGTTFMGQARNTIPDPTLNVHPANFYLERFGVPDKIDPNNLDDLPRNTETIASTFQDSSPTVVANYIVESSLYNQSFEHFVILPPKVSDKGKGVTSNVLRFNSAPWDIAPEGASGSVIRHEMETTTMTLERYGQSMEMMDDFANTPEGEEMYNYYIETMKNDLILSGQIAVMTALLRCYDNKRAYMQRFGGGMTRNTGLDAHTSMFGVMYKNEKAFYKLSDYAKTMGLTQNAAPFTHVFMTYATKTQAALGDNFENEYYRRGPKSSLYLEGGTAAVTTMPGTGLQIITEPDYNDLDGTEMKPGERLQMLENDVSIGRWNAILLDQQIVTEEFPVPNRDMSLGYINFDIGNGQIQIQEYTSLLRALICWQKDGDLRENVYSTMVSGGYAEELGKQLGITELTSRTRVNDGALIDPFIVDGRGGIRQIVRYVGNMHSAYLDYNSMRRIAGSAYNVVKESMTDRDWLDIDKALRFLDENYNVNPLDDDVRAFVIATCGIEAKTTTFEVASENSDPEEIPQNDTTFKRIPKNIHGCYDIPSSSNFEYVVNNNNTFPGFSCMQHLRTVNDFYNSANFLKWRNTIRDNISADASTAFVMKIKGACAGLTALDKFAKLCKGIWSSAASVPNAFFHPASLPFWMRGRDSRNNERDAFLQNIVIGLRYPAGLVQQEYKGATADSEMKSKTTPNLPIANGPYKGLSVFKAMGNFFKFDEYFPKVDSKLMYIGMLEHGSLGEFEQEMMLQPENVFRRFEKSPMLPGGVDSVMEAITNVFTEEDWAAFDQRNGQRLFGQFFGLLMTYIIRKVDANKEYISEPFTPDLLQSTVTLAKVTIRKKIVGKRKFVRVNDYDAERAAYDINSYNWSDGYEASNLTDIKIINTTLSFTPKYWSELRPNADIIVPTNVNAPGVSWMTDLGATVRNKYSSEYKDYLNLASRGKYDIDATRMGNFAGSAFEFRPASPPKKRMRHEDNGQSSGAKYVSLGQRRDPFPSDMDPRIRDNIVNQDESHTEIWSEFNSGHEGLMVGTGSPIVQEANLFFQQRWKHCVDRHEDNMGLLAQYLLLLGQAVNRDAFIQMAEMGVPAPIGILTVDPMIKLTMSHAVFVSAGCGNLYYAFENTSQGYDSNHKKLTVYMTIWMKGFVQIPQNVFIAENISFAGYLGGGDGSLIHTVADVDNEEDEPENGFDYDPLNPTDRHGNRFVLHVGISTKLRDIPNPLPLNGSFGGQGAMSGLGRYVNDQNVYVDRSGALYDSALITNEITKFYQLNTRTGDAMGVEDYFDRTKAIGQSNNLVCFQADQFGFNKATGDHRLRKLIGTGHLGKCCEGVTPQLNGEPGLFSTSLALTGQ